MEKSKVTNPVLDGIDENAFASAFDRGKQASRKREAILDVASNLFNRQGFAATTLEDVASCLQLTKAALYYYVKNKEDLASQCYQRTLVQQAMYLRAADAAGNTGFEKVVAFIRNTLRQASHPSAILTEVEALKPAHREPLLEASHANSLRLRKFISSGIDDGSITPCDPVLVSLAIIGGMSWVPQWYRREEKAEPLEEIAESFIDLYSNGLRPAAGAPYQPLVTPFPKLDGQSGEIFNREEQARLKRAALLKAATSSFNKKGVAATSLEEVVQSLKVTKGAFYYYVKSKEDLLSLCYSSSLDTLEQIVAQADSHGGTGLEKLALAIRWSVIGHCGPQGPFAVFFGNPGISGQKLNEIVARATQLDNTTARFLTVGIKDGSIRACNPKHTLLAMVGALAWLPKWYRPDGGKDPAEIATGFTNLFADGLLPKAN